jgi:glutamate/tyrosine decarboxylase-like PLP-dependent enzyme
VLLLRHQGLLDSNFSAEPAAYLFHGAADAPPGARHPLQCDIGLKTPQCGRRADALKLWLMWKYYGQAGFAKQIDRCWDLAAFFHQQLQRRPNFLSVLPQPQCLNICFWYIPPAVHRARGSTTPVTSVLQLLPCFHEELAAATKLIQRRLREDGLALTDISPLPQRPHFLRFILNNYKSTPTEFLSLLNSIEAYFADPSEPPDSPGTP